VAGNGIPLKCLQSHQCSPHRISINTWKNYLSCSLNSFMFNICIAYHLIHIIFLNPAMTFRTHSIYLTWTLLTFTQTGKWDTV
jgi:hypothetical protein